MSETSITAVVLAAGLSTRMKSEVPKALHSLCGWPLIFYPLEALRKAHAKKTIVVVGYKKKEVQASILSRFRNITFVEQKKQLGTAHAVKCALPQLEKRCENILIMNGDMPLIHPNTIKKLVAFHIKENADVSLISAEFENPPPYGRIIRYGENRVLRIVEELEATEEEKKIKEVNAGLYCVKRDFLIKTLTKIGNQNKKGEFYLPDLVSYTDRATVVKLESETEILGINDRAELDWARFLIQGHINTYHMLSGVTLINAQNIYIDQDVQIAPDVTIYPNSHLKGKTRISKNSIIESHCLISDSIIHENCHIKQGSIIEESIVESAVTIGPMARLRPLSHVKKGARVGNFVELKKTTLGEGAKANHLTYLGDATIGAKVNVGCGVITCNYDGTPVKKKTIIEKDAFIGSDCQLVAPVKIGKGAYIGSGSTITKNVPAGALAVAREKQVIKLGYSKKILKRKKG